MSMNADTNLLKGPFIMRELSIFVNEGIESLRNDGAAKNQKGNIIVQLQLFIRIQIFFFLTPSKQFFLLMSMRLNVIS